MKKLRQSSNEVVVNLSNAQVKMNDMKAKINHVRSLNENYQILVDNCWGPLSSEGPQKHN
jgi:cystathionine beta-lyase family protein involved in aluminum resistance